VNPAFLKKQVMTYLLVQKENFVAEVKNRSVQLKKLTKLQHRNYLGPQQVHSSTQRLILLQEASPYPKFFRFLCQQREHISESMLQQLAG
jgi:hypothetical protein